MLRKLYNKTIELAGNKKSKFFLGGISFIESFIFPIPPDVVIIPMAIAKPRKWFNIAFIATTGSVLGAILGYFIGYIFFSEIPSINTIIGAVIISLSGLFVIRRQKKLGKIN